nr:FK56-binding protein 1 [Cryptomonas curvata]
MYYCCFNLNYKIETSSCSFEYLNTLNLKFKWTLLRNKEKNLFHINFKKKTFFPFRNFTNLTMNNFQETNILEDLNSDGGVIKKIIKAGNGLAVKDKFTVKVHYEGKLESGVIFDSSYERKEPYVFIIGEGKVIKGWEIGIKTMKVGEKAKFEILPSYGYKKKGIPPIIPPDAKLFFEIEVLEAVESENFKETLVTDLDREIARTPADIAKDYENRLKKKIKENKERSFENFFFISPFRSQTGQQAPWWLNPNITFILVFFFVFILFGIVLSLGGIHQGYIGKNFDANFLKD